MEEKIIFYFDRAGPGNTDDAILAARCRAKELGIRHLVVASNSGETGLKVYESFKDLGANMVVVTLHAGRWSVYRPPDARKLERLREGGVKVLTCTQALLGNVEMAIRERFGGLQPSELITQTYYTISQGMKVVVEITLMAADANLIPVTEEVMAIAGTGGGADTVAILKPSYTNRFFDVEIREIVAMPREKSR
ncbi:MAG: hypothetical protein NWE79_03425 [Candidatus Bathyarchaeota archaeon]|nr:hypothetical protein [Candidatus Bathyarchaeota archaeon]